MLIKSRIEEGLTLGKLRDFSTIDKRDILWVEMLKSSKRDFYFNIEGHRYSVLPLLSYCISVGLNSKDGICNKESLNNSQRLMRYVTNVLVEEYGFDKINISNKKDIIHKYADSLEAIEDDVMYGRDNIVALEMHLKYLKSIDKLNTHTKEVLNGVTLNEMYLTMLSLKYLLEYQDGYNIICDTVLTIFYNIEERLTRGISKVDLKELEFVYLCLREYLKGFIVSSDVAMDTLGIIDAYLTLDSYKDNKDVINRLDAINTIVTPLVGGEGYGTQMVIAVKNACINVVKMGSTVATNEIVNSSILAIKSKDADILKMRKDMKNNERAFNRELKTMRNDLKAKEKDLIYANKQIVKLNDIISNKDKESGVANLEQTLDEKLTYIKELEAKLSQKDKRISSLESKNSELSALKVVSKDESTVVSKEIAITEEVTLEDKIKAIKDKNYVLVGGNSTLESGLKRLLPNITFKKHMLNFDISPKVDYVLVYTKNIGHCHSYRVDTFSANVKDVISLYNSNIPKIVDTLYGKIV